MVGFLAYAAAISASCRAIGRDAACCLLVAGCRAGEETSLGAPGNFIVAYDPVTGRQLWRAGFTAPVSNTPITYMVNERQQLIVAAGDALYAFALQQ